MTNYIALLRGINVSGHRLIKMADLKSMFEGMGFGRVQTYIQSGNVLFESADDADALRRRIEHEIEATFGFPVPVVLRTTAEFERILANCPFAALAEGESLYVALLADVPTQEGVDKLLACTSETDEFRLVGREVYLLYRQKSHESMFTNNFLERKLSVAATSRNWQTMTRLAALGTAMED